MDLQCVSVLHVELSKGTYQLHVDLRRLKEGDATTEVLAHRVGTITGLHSVAIEEKTDGVGRFALTLAKGVHQLFQLGRSLDLEEDLIVVVRHLDV